MPRLRERQIVPEVMDQPGLDAPRHRQALAGLERINRVSRSADGVWPAIQAVAARQAGPVRLLDVACGGGDVLVTIAQRAAAEGVALECAGCDISELAVNEARRRGQPFAAMQAEGHSRRALRFFRLDVLAGALPVGYDIMMSCLFLHHLPRETARDLLGKMGRASPHVVVNDLERSGWGLAAAWAGTRMLSRSPVVHVDGPRSVRAAFTADELGELAAEAGLSDIRVQRRWPFRLLLTAAGSGGSASG